MTPYEMIREAEEKMRTMVLNLDLKKEEQVILLINAAETYPGMSRYQVMRARVFLIDLYISHGIYGNARDLCRAALEEYPKAPVKKKLREMEKIREERPEDFLHSVSIDMVDEDLCYHSEPDREIYDPVFEKEIAERAAALPAELRKEFYEIRAKRKRTLGVPLTFEELDILTIETMEKSVRGKS